MERYIKAKDLVDWCNEYYGKQNTIQGKEYFNAFLQAVVVCPSADVVPKSEVDELKQYCSNREEEVMRLHKELADMLTSEQTELHIPMEYVVRVRVKHPVYKAIKSEVAREIFEEIERFLYLHFRFCKEEIGNDDTEYVKGRMELNTQIQNFIANLKKKYTEVENDRKAD